MSKSYTNKIDCKIVASVIVVSILLFSASAFALEPLNDLTFNGYYSRKSISDVKPVTCKDNVIYLTYGIDLSKFFPVSNNFKYLTIGCGLELENLFDPQNYDMASNVESSPWLSLANHVSYPNLDEDNSGDVDIEEEAFFAKLGGSLKILDANDPENYSGQDLSLDLTAGLNLNMINPLAIHAGCSWKPADFIALRVGFCQNLSEVEGMLEFASYPTGAVEFSWNGFDYSYSYKGDSSSGTHSFSVSISPDFLELARENLVALASL